MTVFFLCGLWHGASWTFAIWGLYHGAFLILERAGGGFLLERAPAPLRHAYAMIVVVIGWVLFRSETLAQALAFLSAMVGLGGGTGLEHNAELYFSNRFTLVFAVGVVASTPCLPCLKARYATLCLATSDTALSLASVSRRTLVACSAVALQLGLFVLCAMELASSSYNPFIYFRF